MDWLQQLTLLGVALLCVGGGPFIVYLVVRMGATAFYQSKLEFMRQVEKEELLHGL